MWLPGRRGLRFSVRSKSARSRIQTSRKRRPKLLCEHEILEESMESVIGVGWHHHMTLALLASWFLELERTRVGGKNTGGDGPADPADLQSIAPEASGEVGSDRGGRDTCSAA